ncbi:hypothetical protein LPJ68_001764 [Coemansia sp. RSA 1086]|nr:hypothetical protein LPJ68_001764 [Coemansia sp. RSA 1086]
MTAHNTSQDEATSSAILTDIADTIIADDNSSPVPHLTNANYRIITAKDGASKSRIPQQASGNLPPWITPDSKTYFPAKSPVIGRDKDDDDDDVPMGVKDVNADNTQELRTEYDVLPYEIHSWSNHAANFLPHNIMTDRPHDQSSRWSTNANNHRQFITLRLERPALVPHVCNLKEFKVFGGMSEDNMVELLYSGLRNDSESEVISVKQKLGGHYIPCQFIKIQPLLAYDQKFNFSVWHVELRGTINQHIVQRICDDFSHFQKQEAVRLCLKFFRDRGYNDAFSALAQQTQQQLEAPLLTQLRDALVENCNYERAEQLLRDAEQKEMFQACASKVPYAARWTSVGSETYAMPPARGGHQMCIDEERRVVYLYGGWDGAKNLDDLWMFSIDTGRWVCLSTSTRIQGGPGPRSCHSMCFDSIRKCIYVMGNYVDREYRGSASLDSDLYCYDTISNEWLVLSENTEVLGGPRLIFNSQMVFDSHYHRIYLYGGKVVLPDSADAPIVYSGLYSFDIRKHRWTKLKPDFHMLEQEQHVRARYFHAMLIDSEQQRLYIISNRRDMSVPSEFIIYDIESDTFFEKMPDLTASTQNIMTQERYLHEKHYGSTVSPAPIRHQRLHPDFSDHNPVHVHLLQDGRTIRATFDKARQEIYVLVAVQNDTHSCSRTSPREFVAALRGSRSYGYYGQCTDSTYTGSLYSQSFGAGFHPCSSLMDSGVRYEPERPCASTSRHRGSAKDGSSKTSSHSKSSPDHIFMAVYCYHIPSELWTEVYNSANIESHHAGAAVESLAQSSSSSPAALYPKPRFAQDWVFDAATRSHFMFGGNPNRPNDRSARFNDTWKLEFTRPTSKDILRRALYMVRRQRFLDMCLGTEPLIPCTSQPEPIRQAGQSEYGASAIPSPNSGVAESPELSSAPPKRPSSSMDIEEPKQQPEKIFAFDDFAKGSTSRSTSLSTDCNCLPRDRTAHALAYLQRFVAPLVKPDDARECQSFHSLSIALFQMAESADKTPKMAPEELRKVHSEVYEALLVYFSKRQQQPPSHLEKMVSSIIS